VTPPHGASLLPAGTYQVTTAEAWTWVEIPIRGAGWVALDPAPGTYAGQTPPRTGASPSPSPSPKPSQNAQLTHSNDGGHAVAPSSNTPHSKGLSTLALIVIVLGSIALVLAAFLTFLLSRKVTRLRRRRGQADPRRRLLGAWQESIDVLVEAGLPDLTNATSAEVAASAETRFGPEPGTQARQLGDAANAAIFRPSSPVAAGEADAAWRAHAILRRTVRRRLGVRDRVRARLRYNRPRSGILPRIAHFPRAKRTTRGERAVGHSSSSRWARRR
jgi:hypothetical protein